MVFFEFLHEVLGMVWRVVLDDVQRVVAVDLVDVFLKLRALLSINLLNLLEAT